MAIYVLCYPVFLLFCRQTQRLTCMVDRLKKKIVEKRFSPQQPLWSKAAQMRAQAIMQEDYKNNAWRNIASRSTPLSLTTIFISGSWVLLCF